MSLSLPKLIKEQIRELIYDKDSLLQGKFADVEGLVGYGISLNSEWEMVWTILQPYYPNPSDFVPAIVTIITNWCQAFVSWAETETNETAVDHLLQYLKGPQRINLVLEVNARSTRPTSSWRALASDFSIAIPKAKPAEEHTIENGFFEDLLGLYRSPSVQLPIRARGVENSKDTLPDITELDGPGDVTELPPYRLVVKQVEKDYVKVFCSHERTILLLDGYLNRWLKHSTDSTRSPLGFVRLHQSVFGLGLGYDSLHLKAANGLTVSPMLILTLVENVLGYAPVGNGSATIEGWEFKRLEAFK